MAWTHPSSRSVRQGISWPSVKPDEQRKRNKKVAIKPLLPVLTVLHLNICSPTHRSPSLLCFVRHDEHLHGSITLKPFGIRRFYTDGWGAYERHIDPEQYVVGTQPTQTIESKPINLRTRIKRLVRRTIGFSRTTTIHDLVIGLLINRYEFGRLISCRFNSSETPSSRNRRRLCQSD
jgi:insertion element IS1 protein InsB